MPTPPIVYTVFVRYADTTDFEIVFRTMEYEELKAVAQSLMPVAQQIGAVAGMLESRGLSRRVQ